MTDPEVMAGRREIVRLVQENRELRALLRQERADHALEVRRLTAFINEGTSQEAEALRLYSSKRS